jgi:glycosyltransferase involved in cell wall biosynthesis
MTDCPTISPVVSDAPRPFWSVMIPTFNPHPNFLAQTLDAVLTQDPGPATMEICVVDDCSSGGDPCAALRGGQRERISSFRHARHVGIGGNWNTCIERARGHWVHILHQDDLVRPGFYDRLRQGIDAAPAVGAAFCRDIVIDAQGQPKWSQALLRDTPGILDDWIEHVFVGLHLRASALVVQRSVYEALGGFRLDMEYALDWDMWKRIAAAYPLWYEPETLACYRRHPTSASFTFLRSGDNIAEIRRSIELSAAVLPAAIAADVTRKTRATYTKYAVTTAWRALLARDLRATIAQIRGARKLTSTLAVALAIGRFLPKARHVPR